MRKINTLLLLILAVSTFSHQALWAQGGSCATATPFCTNGAGAGFSFSNVTGSATAQSGPSYGCLCNTAWQVRPSWFLMKTTAAGTHTYTLSQSNGDVDFVAWGPFSSPNNCGNLVGSCNSSCSDAVHPTCSGGIADCSSSPAAIES